MSAIKFIASAGRNNLPYWMPESMHAVENSQRQTKTMLLVVSERFYECVKPRVQAPDTTSTTIKTYFSLVSYP